MKEPSVLYLTVPSCARDGWCFLKQHLGTSRGVPAHVLSAAPRQQPVLTAHAGRKNSIISCTTKKERERVTEGAARNGP